MISDYISGNHIERSLHTLGDAGEVPTSFFFNHPPAPLLYTLSLHDALPIFAPGLVEPDDPRAGHGHEETKPRGDRRLAGSQDRKSTRLNSSHANISYAVFCLKKKTS